MVVWASWFPRVNYLQLTSITSWHIFIMNVKEPGLWLKRRATTELFLCDLSFHLISTFLMALKQYILDITWWLFFFFFFFFPYIIYSFLTSFFFFFFFFFLFFFFIVFFLFFFLPHIIYPFQHTWFTCFLYSFLCFSFMAAYTFSLCSALIRALF